MAHTTRTPTGNDRNRSSSWIVVLLIVIAIVLRLWLISISALDPRYSDADDGDYFRRALRLAVTGIYLDDSWLIRPPGHIFFFAIWIRLALLLGIPQYGVLFVQLAQTTLAALMVPLAYDTARRLFAARSAGLIFAALIALWYPFIETATVLFTEQIYLFLFLLHFWFLLRYDATSRLRELAAAGAALGSAALTRSPALYALAFVVAWLVLRQIFITRRAQPGSFHIALAAYKPQQLITSILVVVIACLAIVGPWATRNYLVYQRFIPIDTLGQVNLWLDLDENANRNLHISVLRGMPQADRAPYALAQARAILAENPLRLFHKSWPMFRHVWKAQYTEDLYVKHSFFARPLREMTALGLLGDLIWLVLMIAAICALSAPAREGLHHRLFILAWISYALITVIVFHVEPRYLLPLWLLFGLYAAGAGALLRRPFSGARLLPALRAMTLIGFLLLCFTYRDYPAILARGIAREQAGSTADRAYLARDYERAAHYYRAALAAQPNFADAQVGLALALAAQGQHADALATLERGSSRRTELVAGALARDTGDQATAARLLPYVEATAGENIQQWAIDWLHPPPQTALTLGDGLDIGYIAGFSPAEQSATQSFRWLEGSGRIVLPLAEPLQPGSILILRMAGGQPEPTPLRVRFANGDTATLPVTSSSWRAYRLVVPADLAGADRLAFELEAPTFVPARITPGSDDARALSLMIAEIRLQ